jgi:hypothetical protein
MTKTRKTMNRSLAEDGIAVRAAVVARIPDATRELIHNVPNEPDQPKAPRQTKAALLRAMLAEPGGTSLPALMAATGWQAHTLRAALTGLRKAGHDITRHRDGDVSVYAIGPGASSAEAASGDTAATVQIDTAPAAAPVEPSA